MYIEYELLVLYLNNTPIDLLIISLTHRYTIHVQYYNHVILQNRIEVLPVDLTCKVL